MEQTDLANRNYTTISPSAKMLLLMKGYTDIPFARRAAELMMYPEKYAPDYSNKDMTFWGRMLHFEARYKSINQLISGLQAKNFLELSSGFSFRGLAAAQQKDVYYIDTDLPEVIAEKKDFMIPLLKESTGMQGKLELLPLNALDEKQFREVISHFPEGEIVIVNEGLLMYLDTPEKEKLCSIIHNVLKERGGCWITADIYIKNQMDKLELKVDSKTKEFFEKHNIEENKFESFEEAEAFFDRMGFVVEKQAEMDTSRLSTIKYFLETVSKEQLTQMMGKAGKIQATWRLRVK